MFDDLFLFSFFVGLIDLLFFCWGEFSRAIFAACRVYVVILPLVRNSVPLDGNVQVEYLWAVVERKERGWLGSSCPIVC
jgi:hypothetical protein